MTHERVTASVFVSLCPTDLGDRSRCVAALTGAFVCTPCYLVSPPGSALCFQRALSLPRYIFVSDGCLNHHRNMLDLAQQVCRLSVTKCRWKWHIGLDSQDQFLATSRVRGKKHGSEMVTLVTSHELTVAAFRLFPNRTTLTTWLKQTLSQTVGKYTSRGYCDR